ncbi:MAG: FecR domain-containing protein [Nitrospirae bacterium]|nr:FecR domain-containing protein [Nitrospirota bacterium]
MKTCRCITMTFILVFIALFIYQNADAKVDIGSFVAIRGKAIVERDKKSFEAKLRDGVLLHDTVSTLEASRVKMLFIDDSVLTLGEKSRVIIKEFVYGKEKGNKSVVNLIEGKMRSIVGKTSFEIHTPTAVAAARGTAILSEAGIKDGKKFTIFICLEGEFIVKSSSPEITGSFLLTPHMMIIVFEGEPLTQPFLAPAGEIERLLKETEIYTELSIPGPAEIIVLPRAITPEGTEGITSTDIPPPFDQQPVGVETGPNTTPVKIDVEFP